MAPRSVLLSLLLFAPELAKSEQPVRVTTDNRAYCEVLLQRVGTAPAAAYGAAAQLVEEGRQLCHSGHPRTGIAKLRRALRMAMAETQ